MKVREVEGEKEIEGDRKGERERKSVGGGRDGFEISIAMEYSRRPLALLFKRLPGGTRFF